jgi:hypothetical protein
MAREEGSVSSPPCHIRVTEDSILQNVSSPALGLNEHSTCLFHFAFCVSFYLSFQLKTYRKMYIEESRKVPMRPRKNKLRDGAISKAVAATSGYTAVDGAPGYVIMQRDAYKRQVAKAKNEPQLTLLVAVCSGFVNCCHNNRRHVS